MKRIISLIGIIVIFLVAIILFRTYSLEDLQPRSTEVEILVTPLDSASEHLAKALTFPTVSHHPAMMDTSAFGGFHRFLLKTYPRVFNTLDVDTFGTHSLLIHWKGTSKDDPILFMAHQDVVPVANNDIDKWDELPFSGKSKNGLIYGRGALDDKGSMIALLEGTEALLAGGFKPARDIYIFFGQDEEIGGEHGAELCRDHFTEKGIHFELVLDEGGIIADGIVPGTERPVALVGTTEKGYISIDINIDFEGGHSSMPRDTNSITLAAEVIHRLSENNFEARLSEPIDGFLRYLGPHMTFPTRMAIANRWLLEDAIINSYVHSPSGAALVRTTWAPTIVRGGIKDNVIPTRTLLTCNTRILPGETVQDVVAHYKNTLEGLPVEITIHSNFSVEPSPVTSDTSAAFKNLSSVIVQEFPDCLVAPYIVVGATDGRFFTELSDNVLRFIPFFFKQPDLKKLHGINESVSPENFNGAVRFYIRAMSELSKS